MHTEVMRQQKANIKCHKLTARSYPFHSPHTMSMFGHQTATLLGVEEHSTWDVRASGLPTYSTCTGVALSVWYHWIVTIIMCRENV